MSVQADVQLLRARQPRERIRSLVDPEEKVAAPLRHEHGRRHRPELREARARGGPRLHDRHLARERRRLHRIERRIAPLGRDRAREAGDEARLDEPLRHQCGVEIGPRLDRDHGRPRDAGHERVEDRSAPVGDAPGADLRVGHVGPRGEPVEHLPRVRDLPRPVDADEPAGLPVPSCVEGEDCVSARERRIALDQRVHLLAVARDAVEEDDGRPAARRWGAVREVESRGERDAVVRRDRDVLLGRDRAVCIAGDEDECRRERGEQGLHHGAQGSPSGHGRCLTPCLTPGVSRSAASGV